MTNSTCSSKNIFFAAISGLSAKQGEIPTLRQKQDAFGHHLIIDLYDCESQNMSDEPAVREMFRQAARAAKCHVVNDFYHPFSPHGLSGMTVISESHFSFHGWDEDGYAAIDLFYCGANVEIEKAIQVIAQFFEPKYVEIQEFQRGNRHYKF